MSALASTGQPNSADRHLHKSFTARMVVVAVTICSYCGTDKSTGVIDKAGAFFCSDCIDEEDMTVCERCGAMFPSSDIPRSSSHGKVCKSCGQYLDRGLAGGTL